MAEDSSVHPGAPDSDEPNGSGNNAEIRDELMQLLTEQLRFRRFMQDGLGVDSAGLTTMIHLAGVGTDSPTAIAGALETSTAATSLVLNRLEASGHISRTAHPTDRRKVLIAASPDSIARARQRAYPIIEGIDKLTASLEPAVRESITDFLDGVIRVYRDALGDKR
ncbi:MAG: MarR family winged helix-turn-helix transcriptional regulator [Rhodococcus sp. (in: high G+C Gram-positive bacteria)]